MTKLNIPAGYQSALSVHDTQIAIKTGQDFFPDVFAQRIGAPGSL